MSGVGDELGRWRWIWGECEGDVRCRRSPRTLLHMEEHVRHISGIWLLKEKDPLFMYHCPFRGICVTSRRPSTFLYCLSSRARYPLEQSSVFVPNFCCVCVFTRTGFFGFCALCASFGLLIQIAEQNMTPLPASFLLSPCSLAQNGFPISSLLFSPPSLLNRPLNFAPFRERLPTCWLNDCNRRGSIGARVGPSWSYERILLGFMLCCKLFQLRYHITYQNFYLKLLLEFLTAF